MTPIGIPKKVVYLWYRQQNLVFVQKYALIHLFLDWIMLYDSTVFSSDNVCVL